MSWFGLKCTILLARIYVEANAGPQADSADNRVVGRAILVRHDTYTRRVLVDKDMVWALVRA